MRGSVQEMKVIYFKTYTLVWFIRKLIAFFLLNICFYRFSPNNGTHGKSKRLDIKGTVSINLGDYKHENVLSLRTFISCACSQSHQSKIE